MGNNAANSILGYVYIKLVILGAVGKTVHIKVLTKNSVY